VKRFRLGPRNFPDAVSWERILHKEEITPVSCRVLRQQAQFLEHVASEHGVGIFYELLSSGLYGGRVHVPVRMPGTDKDSMVIVDVLDSQRKHIREVKARGPKGKLDLRNDQIEKHKLVQRQLTDYRMFFDIYAYTSGFGREMGRDDLFKEIADKTLCSIVLPFSLTLRLHESYDSSLVSWSGGVRNGYDISATIIPFSTLRTLFYTPERLIERLELNPQDYEIRRLKSPGEFYVEGNLTSQFPVLQIEDKDHGAWIKKFLAES